MFKLRFNPTEVAYWATRYSNKNEPQVEKLLPTIMARGWVTKDEFLTICEWKSPRPRPHYQSNSPSFIRAVTNVAFSTPDERLRIEVLTLLSGVRWSVSSVFLHLCHHDPYPILDYRALWSLGIETPPKYDFPFWWTYTEFCRELAAKCSVSMRVLDRALWQYSSERQGAEANDPTP